MNGKAAILLVLAAPSCQAAATLEDPTRPFTYRREAVTVVSSQRAESYKVSAIKISSGQRSAIVNNVTVRPGDRVGSATVIAIDADGVVLQQERNRIKVTLLDVQVKKSVHRPVNGDSKL